MKDLALLFFVFERYSDALSSSSLIFPSIIEDNLPFFSLSFTVLYFGKNPYSLFFPNVSDIKSHELCPSQV